MAPGELVLPSSNFLYLQKANPRNLYNTCPVVCPLVECSRNTPCAQWASCGRTGNCVCPVVCPLVECSRNTPCAQWASCGRTGNCELFSVSDSPSLSRHSLQGRRLRRSKVNAIKIPAKWYQLASFHPSLWLAAGLPCPLTHLWTSSSPCLLLSSALWSPPSELQLRSSDSPDTRDVWSAPLPPAHPHSARLARCVSSPGLLASHPPPPPPPPPPRDLVCCELFLFVTSIKRKARRRTLGGEMLP